MGASVKHHENRTSAPFAFIPFGFDPLEEHTRLSNQSTIKCVIVHLSRCVNKHDTYVHNACMNETTC